MNILIVAAIKPEYHAVRNKFALQENKTKDTDRNNRRIRYAAGKNGKHNVLLVLGRIGFRADGEVLRRLVREYRAELIVDAGTAGAINNSLQPGTLVISAASIDMRSDSWKKLPAETMGNTAELDEVVYETAAGCSLEVRTGTIITTDKPVNGKKRRLEYAKIGGDCCTMETAAVNLFAAQLELPFCAIRIISDHANAGAAVEFTANVKKRSEELAVFLGVLFKRTANPLKVLLHNT
ncbi:MAG: hypothetical protein K9L75_03575 [Spirochaetia bacterium]|nr:hypothetical protein [Spirochaetales bacterium]MCF7944600.1 hypothetical protein [Spirochaetia bacterium]